MKLINHNSGLLKLLNFSIEIDWIIMPFLILILFKGQTQFSNVTLDAKLHHTHGNTALMGGGAVFFDLNNDGWLDIYMTGGSYTDKLYLNRGNKTFDDISNRLPHNNYKSSNTSGAISGDFNNDGWQDLFITTFNESSSCILLRNNGDNSFTNISNSANIVDNHKSIGAALFDFNSDGLLDIYVIAHIQTPGFHRDDNGNVIGYDHECAANLMYENKGDLKFKENAANYNIAGKGCALAVTSSRFLENKPGIYIANDFGEWIEPNELFLYDPTTEGIFTESSSQYGLDVGIYGMGIGIGDFDDDLDLDLYITNLGSNVFLVNKNGVYIDRAKEFGIQNTFAPDDSLLATSWGTFFFDYDNDSDLDLYVANGYINSSDIIPTSEIDPCKLYQNIGHGVSYLDRTEENGLGFENINRGTVYGDYDNDGDLDILLATIRPGGNTEIPEMRYQLFENQYEGNNFVDFFLEGVHNSRDGYGSRIFVYTCDRTHIQYLYSGGTFASQNSKTIHFGLAKCDAIDSVAVYWPNGQIDVFYDLPSNERILLRESENEFWILGCMDESAPNYNPRAQINSGCVEEMTTSIDRIGYDEQVFQIVPTVNRGSVRFKSNEEWGETIVQCYNISGQRLFHSAFYIDEEQWYTIDLGDLVDGIYFLRFVNSQKYLFQAERIVIFR